MRNYLAITSRSWYCHMAKTNKMSVRSAKTQISLGIRPVWSLSAWRNLGSLVTHWTHGEDSDRTGRMPRLIRVFAGHTVTLLVLSCSGSNLNSDPWDQIEPEHDKTNKMPSLIELFDVGLWVVIMTHGFFRQTMKTLTDWSFCWFCHAQVYIALPLLLWLHMSRSLNCEAMAVRFILQHITEMYNNDGKGDVFLLNLSYPSFYSIKKAINFISILTTAYTVQKIYWHSSYKYTTQTLLSIEFHYHANAEIICNYAPSPPPLPPTPHDNLKI